ncbi:hypothetical protein A5724_05090 [Mycobacterium sp. ACS1612]|uniref:DUF732 domain-containing protein n=1 Tax=Mycobacterium sp. ACS1612 TaxID=1834117 RepID=UPI0007FE3A36|nr:DUF732 domain-containing protein [Mycobacterium sp. ACS1612]OBF40961.1 hypothetical protein A5724_05090 [Mycobacterium sp. ACS1612]
MKFAIGGFATTLFALLAIATAPASTASPDDDFLAALTRSGISFPPQVGLNLISAGHNVCAKLAKGDPYDDVVSYVSKGLGNNKGLTTSFISAATNTLCPGHR